MTVPALVKGTRDFGPEDFRRRQWILDTVRQVYERYGFQPLETPAMELLSTLNETYGEEGDKLIFRILNSGDFMSAIPYPNPPRGSWTADGLTPSRVIPLISEKALRYDLTVPFARYVSQNAGQITFPFKRYQIQPVWRADRPQKGRFREFYQCDADVIGSESPLYETEFLFIFQTVFAALGLAQHVRIRVNHRLLLQAFCHWCGGNDTAFPVFCILWDKSDKVPWKKLQTEFETRGFDPQKVQQLAYLRERLVEQPTQDNVWQELEGFAAKNGLELSVVDTLQSILQPYLNINQKTENRRSSEANVTVHLDVSLARGLDYYTGMVFEATPMDGGGSLAGGGRYDNLTGRFGKPGLSGVGISFGADRIFDYMKDKGLLDNLAAPSGPLLLMALLEDPTPQAWWDCVWQLRHVYEIPTEIFPEKARLKKQIEWAVKKNIPFLGLAGPDELQEGRIALKNLKTGAQHNFLPHEAADYILHHGR